MPAAVKLTDKPEDAVALTMKSASPNVLFVKTSNVIVWFPFKTWTVAVDVPPMTGTKCPVPSS